MKKYFVKTPWLLKKIFSSYTWSIDTNEKILYLTFDDGPHPVATTFVLNELKKYKAKATFFCLGKNVAAHPELYRQIIKEGHHVGNHTYNHLNGWKTKNEIYLANITEAAKLIDSNLFRPPYGRIKSAQVRSLNKVLGRKIEVVMWDVLSGDFDQKTTPDKCLQNVIRAAEPGSIVVFHDSEKAFPRLEYVLPKILKDFSEKGYFFCSLVSS